MRKFYTYYSYFLASSLAFIFAFCLLTPAFADAPPVSTNTTEGRLAVFDDAWQTICERYYDPAFHGLDWEAQRQLFRPLAANARNPTEFYSILRRMIGSLQDAHTRVYMPDEKFDWQHPRFISIGVSVREVEGQPVVVQVELDSEAARAGLRPGDTLKTIDDVPALQLFAQRLEEQAGSSTIAAARLRAISTLFAGAPGSTVKVGWIDAHGKEREASLRREWREREDSLRLRRVKGGYVLVQFDAFTLRSAVDLLRSLNGKLHQAPGLILDLRNNGGGEAEMMTEIASAFLPAGLSLGQFMDRTGRLAFAPQTRATMLFVPDFIRRFQAPLIILTSERTSSAAEIFASSMSQAHRATIIGTQTCGCVLAIRRQHTLPDGGKLDVSEMDYHTATGERLEGVGVMPSEKVLLNIKDLQAGRDRAIEVAIERLTIMNRK